MSHALRGGGRADAGRVGDPDVALAVDVHAVRPGEQSGAEALEQPAVQVELEDGRQLLAVDARVLAAPLGDPDGPAVGAGVDRANRAVPAAVGQLPERLRRDAVRIVLCRGCTADDQQRHRDERRPRSTFGRHRVDSEGVGDGKYVVKLARRGRADQPSPSRGVARGRPAVS